MRLQGVIMLYSWVYAKALLMQEATSKNRTVLDT